jgi:LuxR family maltose regulon positive regulatory protein
MIPGDLQQHSPNLLLARAWIAHHEYQQDMLVELSNKASRLIEQEGSADALRGEIYYFQGIIHFYSGNGKSSLQLFEKSRALFPGNQRHIEGQLELHLNLSLYMVGQKDKAISQLNKLVRQMRLPVNIFTSRVVAGLAFIHMFSGDLPELVEEGRRLEAFARKSRLDYTGAFATYMQGYAHLHAWDPDPASKHLALTVQQRYILHIRASMDGMAGLALVQQLRGKTAAATATMDQLEEFVTGLNKSEYMQVVYSCRGRIALLRGDLVSAFHWGELITETPSPAATFIWLEVPCITRARILIAEGSVNHLDKASDLLKDLRQISEHCRHMNQLIEITLLQALLLEKQGRREQALDALAEAAELSGPGGWVRPFIEPGPPMLELLLALQQRNAHPGYIEKLIKVLKHQTFDVETEVTEYSSESQREQLSWRELEVLALLAEGLRNKEIADRLFISEVTIKKHLHNSFKKLNVTNRFQLVEIATDIGLLDNK